MGHRPSPQEPSGSLSANEAYMSLADTLQRSTIGSVDATRAETDPTDRSPGQSGRGRGTRIPQAGRPLPGAPERCLWLRPHLHQPSGARDHQPDRGPVMENRRRTGNPVKSVCEVDGSLDLGTGWATAPSGCWEAPSGSLKERRASPANLFWSVAKFLLAMRGDWFTQMQFLRSAD